MPETELKLTISFIHHLFNIGSIRISHLYMPVIKSANVDNKPLLPRACPKAWRMRGRGAVPYGSFLPFSPVNESLAGQEQKLLQI